VVIRDDIPVRIEDHTGSGTLLGAMGATTRRAWRSTGTTWRFHAWRLITGSRRRATEWSARRKLATTFATAFPSTGNGNVDDRRRDRLDDF